MNLVLPIILLVLIAWLLIIRPARKRQAEFRETQAALGAGEKVLLSSGIYGTVTAINDDRLSVQIADNTTIEVHRGAIARVLTED